MGPGNLGHRLHRFHVQDPQIGLPAVEPEQRIMIGTEPRGQTLLGNGLVEHAAERWPIDGNGLHPKADDAAGKRPYRPENALSHFFLREHFQGGRDAGSTGRVGEPTTPDSPKESIH